MSDTSSPDFQKAEHLGSTLFKQSPEAWAKVYAVNASSIHFVAAAFLGLLDKGSREMHGYTSSVINITSISGITKLSQDQVRVALAFSNSRLTWTPS